MTHSVWGYSWRGGRDKEGSLTRRLDGGGHDQINQIIKDQTSGRASGDLAEIDWMRAPEEEAVVGDQNCQRTTRRHSRGCGACSYGSRA